jgi:thiamine-phosphate pyrophosphorylase
LKAYAIANFERTTDRTRFLERVERLSDSGVDLIQLRAKELEDRDLLELAIECRARVGQRTSYMINGRADIALVSGADGVHLPARGVPPRAVRRISRSLRIGRSCHSLEECRKSAGDGADLLLFGPLFPARSSSKEATVTIEQISRAADMRAEVYALGGLSLERLPMLGGTSVAGVAGITLFMEDEPVETIIRLIHEMES